VALDNVRFARAEVPNAPASSPGGRGGDPRNESITHPADVDGRVFLAGLPQGKVSSPVVRNPVPPRQEGTRWRVPRDLPRLTRPARDQVADPDLRDLSHR